MFNGTVSQKRKLLIKRGARFLALVIIWLFVGTLFYGFAPNSDLGWVMGFFMAVNVGYSIGTGFPAEAHQNYLWFSTFYVICGASFVAMALSFFADKISEDHDNWFTNLMQQKEYERALTKGISFRQRAKAIYIQYRAVTRAMMLWVTWLFAMVVYSKYQVGWSWSESQYFAVSFMSTGGLLGLPPDSKQWMFGLTGVMAMFGVPVMAVAMASVAQLWTRKGDLAATKALIEEEVDIEELIMLQKFGLEDGDGVIDRSEFIILCMVRMGTDPNLINFISRRFAELDEDGGGTLSIPEITCGKFDLIDGQIIALDENGEALCPIDEYSYSEDIDESMYDESMYDESMYDESMYDESMAHSDISDGELEALRQTARSMDMLPEEDEEDVADEEAYSQYSETMEVSNRTEEERKRKSPAEFRNKRSRAGSVDTMESTDESLDIVKDMEIERQVSKKLMQQQQELLQEYEKRREPLVQSIAKEGYPNLKSSMKAAQLATLTEDSDEDTDPNEESKPRLAQSADGTTSETQTSTLSSSIENASKNTSSQQHYSNELNEDSHSDIEAQRWGSKSEELHLSKPKKDESEKNWKSAGKIKLKQEDEKYKSNRRVRYSINQGDSSGHGGRARRPKRMSIAEYRKMHANDNTNAGVQKPGMTRRMSIADYRRQQASKDAGDSLSNSQRDRKQPLSIADYKKRIKQNSEARRKQHAAAKLMLEKRKRDKLASKNESLNVRSAHSPQLNRGGDPLRNLSTFSTFTTFSTSYSPRAQILPDSFWDHLDDDIKAIDEKALKGEDDTGFLVDLQKNITSNIDKVTGDVVSITSNISNKITTDISSIASDVTKKLHLQGQSVMSFGQSATSIGSHSRNSTEANVGGSSSQAGRKHHQNTNMLNDLSIGDSSISSVNSQSQQSGNRAWRHTRKHNRNRLKNIGRAATSANLAAPYSMGSLGQQQDAHISNPAGNAVNANTNIDFTSQSVPPIINNNLVPLSENAPTSYKYYSRKNSV